MGKDMNKYEQPPVAEAGGFAVVIGIAVGLFAYLFLKAFWGTSTHLAEIYATIATILLAGFIGFVDDLLGWKRGLPQWFKPLLTFFLALPFATLALLNPSLNVFVSWGIPLWFFALIIVPVGVIGASNAINMLAGYNGLEAGLVLIILSAIGVKAYLLGNLWIAYMALIA
ncbi:MAG: glycosyl transferase family 4, partial [Candidatus Diapherotrites archaeon]|nr:glycosyl transferase family 4 [Candidatus Diapherotrites archaeon]